MRYLIKKKSHLQTRLLIRLLNKNTQSRFIKKKKPSRINLMSIMSKHIKKRVIIINNMFIMKSRILKNLCNKTRNNHKTMKTTIITLKSQKNIKSPNKKIKNLNCLYTYMKHMIYKSKLKMLFKIKISII